MISKLWNSFLLKCPNCEQGSMSDSFFSMRRDCEVCHVVFERKSGESAGASVIWISILPFFALMIFFAIQVSNPDISPWVSAGIPMSLMLLIGIFSYRNARGLWIGISYLTGAVYADEEDKAESERLKVK